MPKFAFLALGLAWLTGCATTTPDQSAIRSVPADRVSYQSSVDLAKSSVAVFVRDSGVLGALSPINLHIDGKLAASFYPSERLELRIPLGEHVFAVVPSNPLGLASMYSIDQNLQPERVYSYRIIHTPNGSRIHRVIEAE